MKRTVVLYLILGLALAAMPTVITVEGDYMMGREYTGIGLPSTGGLWTLEEGQSLTAQVLNVATLARHGLKGLSKGDEVTMTWLGGYKFRLMHAASGRSVEIVFPKDKVRIKQVKK